MQRLLISTLAYSLLLSPSTLLAKDGPWAQWRGPERDDVSAETGLLQSWPEAGPAKVWANTDCGLGYSGPAIVGERLYIMGERNDEELLLCLDSSTGEELWSVSIQAEQSAEYNDGWGGGPRGTPTVDGDRVYAVGATGKLVCVRASDGSPVWSKNLADLGGTMPKWGYSESPLIHGERLLYTPGGKQGAIVALNKNTGELLWQTADLTDDAHYSSIVVMQHAGKTTGVQLLVSQLVGFDIETGEVLWSAPWPGRVAVIPTPIVSGDTVYATAGYGCGCMLVKLDNEFKPEVLYDNKVMSNHHGGVILLDGHVYGHSDGKGWTCQELATGESVWRERDVLDKGSIAYADGRFYCLGEESGELALIEATTEGWKEQGKFKLEPQSELRSPRGRIWTHPVIADGKLYLRDQQLLYCYDVKAE